MPMECSFCRECPCCCGQRPMTLEKFEQFMCFGPNPLSNDQCLVVYNLVKLAKAAKDECEFLEKYSDRGSTRNLINAVNEVFGD